MNDLWRRTLEFWRRYPVVWLPVIAADAIKYCLFLFRPTAMKRVGHLILHEPSSGGLGLLDSYSPARTAESNIAVGVTKFLFLLGGVFLFLFAAASVKESVSAIGDSESGERFELKPPTAGYARRALWVSFLFMVLFYAASMVIQTPIFLLDQALPQNLHAIAPYLIYSGTWIAFILVAYLMTPICLRLLSRGTAYVVQAETIGLARLSAMLAATASLALFAIIRILPYPNFEGAAAWYLFFGIESQITAIPYVPLFVTFGLLSTQSEDDRAA